MASAITEHAAVKAGVDEKDRTETPEKIEAIEEIHI